MADVISRRKLLNLACCTAAATSAAAAIDLMPPVAAAQNAPANTDGGGSKMPFVSLKPGMQVYYREDWLGAPWVKPETMLLLHGNLESSVSWYGWVPRMGQHFRLLRPDLPGYELSTIPADFDYSLATYAAAMADFLDKLGVTSAHIGGAKTGGAIAMQFAATYPQKTKSLVVASGPFESLSPKVADNSQKVRLGSAATEAEMAYFDKLRAEMNPVTRAGIVKMLTANSVDSILPKIKAPTLIITSDHSALQTVETVLRYQPKIPNSRLLVLTSDAYHVAVANADECVRNVLTFLRATQPPGSVS